MGQIIRNHSVISDPWRLLELTTDGQAPAIPPAGDVIVPLVVWRTARDALRFRAGRIGIWLKADEDPASIADDLPLLGVVAVEFPKVADGRGYTSGRLLRERYGYRGELRAIGDVQRDQLYFLWQCGFDAFVLRPGEDLEQALTAFAELTEAYQSSVVQPVPLFRRRQVSANDGAEWP